VTAPAIDTESIGREAGRGLKWSLLGTTATKIGSFAMGLVLARLLAPADFGIYAIALAATQFVMHIKDAGLMSAIVQWRGKLEDIAPTATTLTAVFSTGIYALLWFAAPLFASLAGSPEATPVVRMLTLIVLIDGLASVRSAALMRSFQQNRLAVANMAGFLVNAGLGISLAATGAGAFSFAGGQVAGVFVTAALVWIWARVPLQVGFDRSIARRLMRFGIPVAASLGLEALVINITFVIVGRGAGTTELGYFLLAFNVSSWVQGTVGTAIRYVSVAGFSRLAEHEPDSLSAGVQRSIPLLVTGLLPVAVPMAVLASPLVSFLYGEQWTAAGPVLRFLMILTVTRMLMSFAGDILVGAGATLATLWMNLGWAAAVIPSLIVGTRLGGIIGAAAAHATVGLLVAIPLSLLALHRAGIRLAPIAPTLGRPLLAGALAVGVTLAVSQVTSAPVLQLCLAGSAGLLTYGAFVVPIDQLRRWNAAIRRRTAHAVD